VQTEPSDAASATRPDERTYVVVMSHNFLRDKDYLRSFLGSGAAYLGMLGPAARLQRLLDDLRRDGYEPPPGAMGVVHGPAGLDLGGDGPEEVGWAIVAEILALSKGRQGGFLKERGGPIHDRPRQPEGSLSPGPA
jgi:xanthine dehydrogenase accessory factor